MINRLFNELFGEDVFEKMVLDFFDGVKEIENEENEEDKDNHTYYHKVKDEYENGQKVSHVEKEVKDGEVLKDVKETYKIEDKKEEKCAIEDKKETCCKCKKEQTDESARQLIEAKNLLDEARSTIQMQMKEIERLQNNYRKLEEEFVDFKKGIRALL